MINKKWYLGCLTLFALLSSSVAEFSGGVIVLIDSNDGKQAVELSHQKNSIVHGLDTDAGEVQAARKYVQSQNLSGTVTIHQFDGKTLPYADNLVNMIVANVDTSVSKSEILRVLTPFGTARIGDKTVTKPWPADMDQWTHFLRGADNNAVSLDPNIKLPRSLQWVDGPRWGRSHEEMASISAVVTANGRLFYITDNAPLATIRFQAQWTLVARDAFNGMKLWSRPIPIWNDHLRHFRSGPAHLPRRLVAVGDKVYVTLGLSDPVSELDARTGDIVKTFKGTEFTEEILYQDKTLYLIAGTAETHRTGAGLSERNEPKPSSFRRILAVDTTRGNVMWKKEAKGPDYILPMGLALSKDKLYYHNIQGLGCLESKTGKPQWFVKRKTPAKRYGFSAPTLVATEEVILLADLTPKEDAQSDVAWGVHGWTVEDKVYPRRGKSDVTAYDAKTGKELWKESCGEGYNSPTDIFVINDLAWLGPFNKKRTETQGLNLKTGEVVKTINTKGNPVGMLHDRCYRQKASVTSIFGGRDGIEILDLEKGWIRNNSWIRGTCQYGIMPANGLMYAPSDACACHSKNRLQGFNVVSSRKAPSFGKPIKEEGRLMKGPAYGRSDDQSKMVDSDWKTYRNNALRSGSTQANVTTKLTKKWSSSIGGRLSQPLTAYGLVYVSSADKNTLYALDKKTGKVKWSYITGGRIDSAPTLYKGLLIAGCTDGKVYCLDAHSGHLSWVFHAAPEHRLIMTYGKLESSWPVHGAVLIKDDMLYFTAGRSSYIDGGIYFYRLDPITGKMLAAKNITSIDPANEASIEEDEKRFDSGGTISDLLSADADTIYMKHLAFNQDGETVASKPHLFSAGGFLGEEWFVRAYWQYGDSMSSGWGGWAKAAGSAPFGRIMSIEDDVIFGYGRESIASQAAGHTLDTYHLYSSAKKGAEKKSSKGGKKGGKKRGGKGKDFRWSNNVNLTIRAMVTTPEYIVAAGVPDMGKKSADILSYDNEQEALDAYQGRKGGLLRIYSKETGEQEVEYKLSAAPVFDGLSIADHAVLMSLKDGTVEYWSN